MAKKQKWIRVLLTNGQYEEIDYGWQCVPDVKRRVLVFTCIKTGEQKEIPSDMVREIIHNTI